MIKQTSGLVFRKVDDLYYVTNPHRHEIAVLNESAFHILEKAHDLTVEKLCELFSHRQGKGGENGGDQTMALDSADVLHCLDSLKSANLISY